MSCVPRYHRKPQILVGLTTVDSFLFMSPPPRSFAECRQETAVRTCYQHHDLGFLCQLSHLGKHLTRPGSMNPAIFRDRGHYPVSADIGLCSDRYDSIKGHNTWIHTPGRKDKLVYRHGFFSPIWMSFWQNTTVQLWRIWMVWLVLSETALSLSLHLLAFVFYHQSRSRSFPRSNPLESSYIVALGEAEALKVMMQISSWNWQQIIG